MMLKARVAVLKTIAPLRPSALLGRERPSARVCFRGWHGKLAGAVPQCQLEMAGGEDHRRCRLGHVHR